MAATGPASYADGFSVFEFVVEHGPPDDLTHGHHLIKAGVSRVFTFDILGTGAFFDTDFTTELSQQFDNDMLMFAAAKFIQGPGDDSAFGASVPEPGVMALLALAGALGGRRRRRK